MSTAKKIVLIGGGSYAWSPKIVKDMLLTPQLADATFVLYDIDAAARSLVARVLQRVQAEGGGRARILATGDRLEAFRDADYFVITVSTGGLDAMAHDLAIPEEFGIYHTVGDTAGPGGWARLMRNFTVFESFAEDFNRYAPRAPILNYTNPLTPLTDVLVRMCDAPVVGLCHALFENLRYLNHIYGVAEEDMEVSYGGLNHFFWMTEISAGDRDLLADLRARVASEGMTAILAECTEDSPVRDLATELFKRTGVMPYCGDRHTCEFYPLYITDREAMAAYHLPRTSIDDRRQQRERQRQELIAIEQGGELPEAYRTRSRETAADIIAAHVADEPFIDVGNLQNTGQIDNLPRGVPVETAVQIDAGGFTPVPFGSLPDSVVRMVEPWARVFQQGVDACFARDKGKALDALRLDPVCSHLSDARVRELGDRLLAAHAPFQPDWR